MEDLVLGHSGPQIIISCSLLKALSQQATVIADYDCKAMCISPKNSLQLHFTYYGPILLTL